MRNKTLAGALAGLIAGFIFGVMGHILYGVVLATLFVWLRGAARGSQVLTERHA